MDEPNEIFHEKITINGKEYEYVMTGSTEVLKMELDKRCCRLPRSTDYRYNPYLSPLVRKMMAEHGTKWAFTTDNGADVLNFYSGDASGNGTPYIVYLSELIDSQGIARNFSGKLIETFRQVGEKKFTALSSEWSPLMIAVSQRKTEIIKILLENGVDANSSDSKGFTPLMLASFLNEVEIMHLLIQHGADVNAYSKNGFSALIYALYANSTAATKILIENGANPSLSLSSKILEEKRSFLETFEFYLGTYSLGGLADTSLVYKKCGMSKQTFSKIRSNKSTYHPKKETALQLALGLRLTIYQAESLLNSAGYVFEENNPVDQIFKTHISHRDFDIHKINEEIYNATGRAFLKE